MKGAARTQQMTKRRDKRGRFVKKPSKQPKVKIDPRIKPRAPKK